MRTKRRTLPAESNGWMCRCMARTMHPPMDFAMPARNGRLSMPAARKEQRTFPAKQIPLSLTYPSVARKKPPAQAAYLQKVSQPGCWQMTLDRRSGSPWRPLVRWMMSLLASPFVETAPGTSAAALWRLAEALRVRMPGRVPFGPSPGRRRSALPRKQRLPKEDPWRKSDAAWSEEYTRWQRGTLFLPREASELDRRESLQKQTVVLARSRERKRKKIHETDNRGVSMVTRFAPAKSRV